MTKRYQKVLQARDAVLRTFGVEPEDKCIKDTVTNGLLSDLTSLLATALCYTVETEPHLLGNTAEALNVMINVMHALKKVTATVEEGINKLNKLHNAQKDYGQGVLL